MAERAPKTTYEAFEAASEENQRLLRQAEKELLPMTTPHTLAAQSYAVPGDGIRRWHIDRGDGVAACDSRLLLDRARSVHAQHSTPSFRCRRNGCGQRWWNLETTP